MYRTWKTFRGKTVSYDTVDHQHLSNCFWYLKIILNASVDNEILFEIKNVSGERFNGQILPYRPHVDFKDEIEYLKDNNHLISSGDGNYDITYNGQIVGEIKYF